MYYKIPTTIALFIFFVCSIPLASAQAVQKIGDNSYTISPSALFEIESTTKGFLPPRMTSAQRDAIASPAVGLTIYNTTNDCIESNTLSGWIVSLVVTGLDCSGAVFFGTPPIEGTTTTNYFVTLPYTGGNGKVYNSQLIPSTGVTGLTAKLDSGILSNNAGGSLVFSISGTAVTGGVASFSFTFGGQVCAFTVNVDTPPGTAVLDNCSSATAGVLTSGVVASGVTQTMHYISGNGAEYSAAGFASTGVTGLVASISAGTLATGSGSVDLFITGTPAGSGTASFVVTFAGSTCSFSRTVAVGAGSIASLNCAGATTTGTLINGFAASGVSSSIGYTGGNGGSHTGQTVTSTGVSGLTATLGAGSFATGSGSLSYSVTGTPSGSGTASFAISIGGQTCSLSVTVAAGTIASLACSGATTSGTLTIGFASSGVSSSIGYTGGNGGSYTGQVVASTGVTGLTATLVAGNFASGSGSLSYSLTGTPSGSGTASFAISVGGQVCSLSVTVVAAGCGAYVASGVYKVFMCHNLGADTTLDPNVPVQGIHGNYYQWGIFTPVANASTPSGAISGWNTVAAADYSWLNSDGTKNPNDPCPAGFRVPTYAQWVGVQIYNTARYTTVPWTNIATNYGSAIHFGSSTSTYTLTLPAAGYRSNNTTDGRLLNRGSTGYYWSSTENGPTARHFDFSSGSVTTNSGDRPFGFSVRCVSE